MFWYETCFANTIDTEIAMAAKISKTNGGAVLLGEHVPKSQPLLTSICLHCITRLALRLISLADIKPISRVTRRRHKITRKEDTKPTRSLVLVSETLKSACNRRPCSASEALVGRSGGGVSRGCGSLLTQASPCKLSDGSQLTEFS